MKKMFLITLLAFAAVSVSFGSEKDCYADCEETSLREIKVISPERCFELCGHNEQSSSSPNLELSDEFMKRLNEAKQEINPYRP